MSGFVDKNRKTTLHQGLFVIIIFRNHISTHLFNNEDYLNTFHVTHRYHCPLFRTNMRTIFAFFIFGLAFQFSEPANVRSDLFMISWPGGRFQMPKFCSVNEDKFSSQNFFSVFVRRLRNCATSYEVSRSVAISVQRCSTASLVIG